jgi:phage shock protein A
VDAHSVAKNNKARLQSLKRQLHDHRKRIAELETQLDALKIIDHSAAKSKSFNVPSP